MLSGAAIPSRRLFVVLRDAITRHVVVGEDHLVFTGAVLGGEAIPPHGLGQVPPWHSNAELVHVPEFGLSL
jgi:hypothetical protein